MRKIFIIISLLMGISALFAGRYAGDFMMIGSGVRSLGMGGAFGAVADDPSAIYWNASGIAQMRQPELGLMHAFLYEGLATYNNVSYCQPLPNEVTIGVNWTRLTINDIPYFDEKYLIGTNVDQRIIYKDLHLPGVPDDEFSSVDDMFQFSFAKHLHRKLNMGWEFFEIPLDFYLGGNVKFIKRKIWKQYGSGTGFDASFLVKSDLAVIFDADWMGTVKYGMNFQDIAGTDITWDTDSQHKDEVLYNTKLAVSVEQPIPVFKSSVILAMDKDYVYKFVEHYGMEWNYDNKAWVRLGFYDENVTTGLSLQLYGIKLDYSFLTNNLGNTNRLGIGLQF